MDRERAAYLLNRYHSGACTPEEHAEFALLLHHPRFEDLRNELLDDHWPREADDSWQRVTPAGYWNVLAAIKVVPRAAQPRGLRRWLPYAAAAVAVLIAVGWLLLGDLRQQPSETRLAATEILPGGNRATLTLADGRTISLSEAQQGIIVGKELSYTDGSEVLDKDTRNEEQRYDRPSGTENGSLTTNYYVLTTPKGGTYQVTLPDGSNVWLNAASTLTYPSRFSHGARNVRLTGEAYFGIAKAEAPFRVMSAGQIVEVLGTEFNISAYPDDSETKTTLVEGKVKLSAGTTGTSVSLTPGEQSILTAGSLDKQYVDIQQYTAWKEGRFMFDGKSFDQIMRELGRWYGLEIQYEGPVPQAKLFGDAFRNENLSFVLKLLDNGGFNYTLDGRTLIIKAGGHQ